MQKGGARLSDRPVNPQDLDTDAQVPLLEAVIMSKKQKQTLWRILASAVLLAAAVLLPLEGWFRLCAFWVPYAVIGWDVLWRAARNISHGQVFDENFLMALATLGAFCIGEYPEAVFVSPTPWASPGSPSPP